MIIVLEHITLKMTELSTLSNLGYIHARYEQKRLIVGIT